MMAPRDLTAADSTAIGDQSEALRFLKLLSQPGDVRELRALHVSNQRYRQPHTVSGYFDYAHLEDMAKAAADITRHARGTYITINPVMPTLIARAYNRVRDVGKDDPLTTDKEIIARRWLPIDLDPVRPAGISSTDMEHKAALDLARHVREVLRERDWSEPILCDSGNGAHLVYPIEREAAYPLAHVLEALGNEFDTEMVKIDRSVFNPARIWKVPGTWARKGDSTPDRPHRMAHILEVPSA